MRKTLRGFLLVAFCVMLLPVFPAHALKREDRTVKIAFPIQPGLSDLDENGNYTGYTYEYLAEIAQYTGWDYEFVMDPGTMEEGLDTLMGQVRDGGADLIGGMLYSKELDALYDFSGHSYGTVETVLQTPFDQPNPLTMSAHSAKPMRIAVLGGSTRVRRELEEYCAINSIGPRYVLCSSEVGQIAAMRMGMADAMLNISTNYIPDTRTIARFAPKPFYFATAQGDPRGLLPALNDALLTIEQTEPNFAADLFEKHFAPVNPPMRLTAAERDYIENAGTIRVGVVENQPPFQFIDGKTGRLTGIAIDLLDVIAEETGLYFELVVADGAGEAYTMANNGQIDLIACMPYRYELAQQYGLSMTRPYETARYTMLVNTNVPEDSLKDRRLVLPHGFAGLIGAERAIGFYPQNTCARMVSDGEADMTCMDSFAAQYYANRPEYSNLRVLSQTYGTQKLCFGVVKEGHGLLVGILNKAVLSIDPSDMQDLVLRNTIRDQQTRLSVFLRAHPGEIIAGVAGILLCVIALLTLMLRQRARVNARLALEFQKHLRVYRLVNDYFFEYDFAAHTVIVSTPGRDAATPDGLSRYDYNHPDENDPQAQQFLNAILDGDGVREIYLSGRDGGAGTWLRIAVETIRQPGGAPAYVVGRVNSINHEKQERDRLLSQAQRDSLTGLLNAATIRAAVAERLASLHPGAFSAYLLLDIDYFKTVNDTFGHLQGDQALLKIAALLRSCFRERDAVGRPGGDEFVVYMHAISSREALETKCTLLCWRARQIFMDETTHLSISVGAAPARPGDCYDDIYQRADDALYRAKENGRDQYFILWDT